MALIINVSGSTKIDETTGLNDDDVASLPSNVSTAFSNAGVNLALAIQFAGGGGDDVTVTPDSGFTVNGLGFVDATNGALDGDASGLFTLENRQIFLYAANNDNVVLGREGTLAGVADPAGTIVFAIYLEETTTGSLITGGKFWTALFEPLKHTDANDHDFTVNLDNKLKVAATESTTFLFDNAPSGANEFMMFGNNPGGVSTSGIVVTGRAPDANTEDNNHKGDTVSSSQAGPHATIGVNGQHLGPGDGLNFTMVTNPVADFTVAPNSAPERLDSTEADHEGNIQFGGYAPGVTSASFTVAQVNPTGSSVQIKISAFNDPNGAAGETGTGFVEGFADDVAVNITEVKINGVVVAADLSGNTAVISGVVNGDVITYTTSAHTRVLIENVQPTKGPGSNITLDIGGFSILSSQGASEFAGTQLQFDDDGPTITAVASTASVRHDETAGVQADTDVPGSDIAFPGTTITSLFTNVPSPGDDPHVPGTGAIGFARSTSPLLTVTGSAGTDGPAAQELSYALSVSDSTDSGVETTAGTKIFMFNGTGNATGLILGRVGTENAGGDTADPAGTVAFALATNPATGEVFLAQYLSLKHPTGGTSYDETITLASGAVQMSVTRTDGDGDTATDSGNNIGLLVKFDDDGPTITAAASGTASVRHDETAGVQADTDVPGSDIAFPGTTITSLFTNVPSPGDDPHVPGTGAIGFARSTNPLVTVTSGSAGADGPAAQELSYALSVSDSTDSGVETTAGTKIFMFNGTGNATGLILGRVGTENANADTADPAGTVAFALATNPATGEVFLAQYLSLKHPTGGTSYDETITLAAGAVQMSVIRTDGDGDTATDSDNNIGLLVKFDDDGPTISPAIADGQVAFANGASDGDTGFLAYGADGPASVGPFKITAFEAMPDNTPLGPITETLSSNDTVLTYSSATHGDLFSLTLDATAPGGYTFTVLQDVPTILNVLDFGSVNPGGPVEEITIAAPGGTNVTFDGFLASDFDGNPTTLKAQFGTGDLDPNPIEDVNVSTQGIGLKDNQMDPNVNAAGQDEALKMSFSQDVDGVQIVFDGATGGGNTFDATFEAYDDGVLVDTITFSGLAAPKGNNTTTVTFNPDPAHDFDELYIGLNLADKSGLRIHQVATIEKADIPDFALDYTVRATDGDADTASDMFTVKIDSNLDGTITV